MKGVKSLLFNSTYLWHGNGLEVLESKDNVDTILISGMGTNTILKILNNNYFRKVKNLI